MAIIYQASQPYVPTKGVHQVIAFIDELRKTRLESNSSPIRLISGDSGGGKSVAARASLRNPDPLRTLEIMFSVPPHVTPSALAAVLAARVDDPLIPKQGKRTAVDKAVTLIQQNELELIIADYAHSFTTKTLQAIQEIRERCSIAIVLVGLRPTKDLLNKVPGIANDIKILEFPPVEVVEVLDLILPQMAIQGWEYNPGNPEDRAIGEYMWNLACPSLFRLRSLVQRIVIISANKSLKLSQALIDQAVKFTSLRDV